MADINIHRPAITINISCDEAEARAILFALGSKCRKHYKEAKLSDEVAMAGDGVYSELLLALEGENEE